MSVPSRGSFLGLFSFSYEHLVISGGMAHIMCILRVLRNSVHAGNEGENPLRDRVCVVRGAFPIPRGLLLGAPSPFPPSPNKCLNRFHLGDQSQNNSLSGILGIGVSVGVVVPRVADVIWGGQQGEGTVKISTSFG